MATKKNKANQLTKREGDRKRMRRGRRDEGSVSERDCEKDAASVKTSKRNATMNSFWNVVCHASNYCYATPPNRSPFPSRPFLAVSLSLCILPYTLLAFFDSKAKQSKGKGGMAELEKSEEDTGRDWRRVLASLGFGLNRKSQEMQLLADLAVSYPNEDGERGRGGIKGKQLPQGCARIR